MGFLITQTCDNCKEMRYPKGSTVQDRLNGGWHELSYGNREKTLCANCIRKIIDLLDKGQQVI